MPPLAPTYNYLSRGTGDQANQSFHQSFFTGDIRLAASSDYKPHIVRLRLQGCLQMDSR